MGIDNTMEKKETKSDAIKDTQNLREKLKLRKITESPTNPSFTERLQGRRRTSKPLYTIALDFALSFFLIMVHPLFYSDN